MDHMEALRKAHSDRRWADVQQAYAVLVTAGTVDPLAHLLAADAANRSGNAVRAEGILTTVLDEVTEWPVRGHVLFSAGIIYSEMGQPEKAATHFEQVIASPEAPPHRVPQAHTNLGLALRQLGQYGEAMVHYRKAADLFAQDANHGARCWALQNMAWAACLAGDAETARSVLAEAALLCETAEDRWHQELGDTFRLSVAGNRAEAAERARGYAGAESLPNAVRAQAAWVAGSAYMLLGDLAGAAAMARQAMELSAGCHPRVAHEAGKLQSAIEAAVR